MSIFTKKELFHHAAHMAAYRSNIRLHEIYLEDGVIASAADRLGKAAKALRAAARVERNSLRRVERNRLKQMAKL